MAKLVRHQTDNLEIRGSEPHSSYQMLENGFKMTASTESFTKMEKIDGFSHSRITPACLETYPELAQFGRALDLGS